MGFSDHILNPSAALSSVAPEVGTPRQETERLAAAGGIPGVVLQRNGCNGAHKPPTTQARCQLSPRQGGTSASAAQGAPAPTNADQEQSQKCLGSRKNQIFLRGGHALPKTLGWRCHQLGLGPRTRQTLGAGGSLFHANNLPVSLNSNLFPKRDLSLGYPWVNLVLSPGSFNLSQGPAAALSSTVQKARLEGGGENRMHPHREAARGLGLSFH